MSTIIPFHGVRYDTTVTGDITQVVAPPYDIIDVAGQKALHDRHQRNIIRLELGLDQPGDGPTHNRYTRAASTLRDWLKSGALKRDAAAGPLLSYDRIYRPLCCAWLADQNSQGHSHHGQTGSTRFGAYLPTREYPFSRENRSAESARSLPRELQPYLVALLRPSRSRDRLIGRGRKGETRARSTFATMWGSVSNSGP